MTAADRSGRSGSAGVAGPGSESASSSAPGAQTAAGPVRRLGIVPATVAVAALLVHLVGLAGAGQLGSDGSWYWLALASVLMLFGLTSGHAAGIYGGLAVSGARAVTSDPTPDPTAAVLIVVTLVAVHEIARFSLDARRPSRFGPGLIRNYAVRSIGLTAAAGLLTAILWPLATDWPDEGRVIWRFLLPIGVAAAGVPLLVRRGVEWMGRRSDRMPPTPVRAALGLAVGLLIAVFVVLGSVARTGIETGTGPPDAPTPTTTTTTAPPTTVVVPDVGAGGQGAVLIALVLLVIALLMLFAALRRPEAVFELDEKVFIEDHGGLGLTAPSRADTSEELIGLDDGRVGRLLDDLAVDLTTEPDPGRAIRFGYAEIERRLSDLGLERGDAETEREFLARALPALRTDGRSLTDLTRLFEQARFSDRPSTEAMRAAALRAIDDLRASMTGPEGADDSDSADAQSDGQSDAQSDGGEADR